MPGSRLPFTLPWHGAREALRTRIAGQVRSVISGQGEKRVVPPGGPGFYPPGSVIRAVHADVTSMMTGGITALLLQMLHPLALAGVLGHSNFRSDMQGRLQRTARFIAVTTYGSRETAEAAIARVDSIHAKVLGVTTDGVPYSARDPHLLAWVHLAESWGFLTAYRRYVRPGMPQADRDAYYAQSALVARKLGARPVPETEAEVEELMRRYRPDLRVTGETREVARLVLAPAREHHPAGWLMAEAAIDLLPEWAAGMLGLRRRTLSALPVRAATFAGAATLRWAFRQPGK